MTEWWNSLLPGEKIYWFFAFPSTALFIIQTIMTFIGLDHHGDVSGADIISHDHGAGSIFQGHASGDISGVSHSGQTGLDDTAAPFKLLTIRNFIIFFTVFSWAGITFTRNHLNGFLVFLLAAVLGIVTTSIISSLFRFISGLTENGAFDFVYAVNCIGEVYLTIPPKMSGTGKIMITVKGVFRELEAMTEGEEIQTGEQVIVTKIVNNQFLLVEKYNEKEKSQCHQLLS